MSKLLAAWPIVLVIVVVLALAILLYLVGLLRKAKKKTVVEDAPPPAQQAAAPKPPEPEPPAAEISAKGGLGRSFRRALRKLSRYVGGRQARYQLPWALLAGAEGSRPRDLLGEAGLNLPFGSPLGGEGESGLAWWLLDHGVVLDLDGGYVLAADGRSSDAMGWRRFLRLAQRYRPRRPLDSVVLTLAAAELAEARRRGPAGMAELERRAAGICQKLWEIERLLGIRCPVYVLVTGCEAVPGFSGLCCALPARHLTEMLGWSTPYSLDAAYRPSWVAEAFRAVSARLGQVQLELYAGASPPTCAEEVFVFPEELATLERPLNGYLDPLFAASAYREGLLLRGIYFTGAVRPADAAGASPAADSDVAHPFLKALFEHKVFREQGLADPTRGTWLARNRRKLALQVGVVALAAILLAGTTRGYFVLRKSQDGLERFLRETAIHVGEVRRAREAEKPLDRGVMVRHAGHLIDGLANLDVDRFGSFFLPSSWRWFTDLDDRLIAATARVQEDIIFRAIGLDLERRARQLTAAPPRPADVAGGDRFRAWASDPAAAPDSDVLILTPVDRMPELIAFSGAVSELSGLEHAAELYNGLPVTRDLHHLAEVIEYLFGTPPPKAFFEHSRLYRQALADIQFPPFKIADYQEAATARVEGLGHAFYRRLFAGNEILAALSALAADLDAVAHGAWAYAADAGTFEQLVARIDLLETALAQPELDWARRPVFDLGPAYNDVLSEIGSSAFLGADLAQRLEKAGEEHWRLMRAELADLGSPVTGPLLTVDDGQPKLQLSTDTVFLKAALESFLGESFLSDAEARTFEAAVRPGTRLFWDVALLEEAVALDEVYKRFESQTLALFPAAMQSAIADVARAQVGARMEDLVARAQRVEPSPKEVSPLLSELELGREIDSFALAVKPLNQLADAFGRLRLTRRQNALSELVAEQGAGLLAGVDRLLAAGAPYRPRQGDFAWWKGEPQVALTAFGAADTAELQLYLDGERQRIGQLARAYAQPLVTWLGKTAIVRRPDVRTLYRRWEGILLTLQEYEAKKPGNALAELEAFIAGGMARIDPESCAPDKTVAAASLGASPAAPPPAPLPSGPFDVSNFFLWRRHDLARQLGERCHGLAADRARSEYDTLARYFNERLAGKFPFADRPPEALAPEAELADLRAFFRLFDPSVGTLRNAQASDPATFGGAAATVLAFCDRMKEVRDFFSPYLDSKEADPELVLDVDVDFRVLRPSSTGQEAGAPVAGAVPASAERELGGERIIDWRLRLGDREVSHRDTERHLAWRPGLPVRLGLRWAENSDRLPAASGSRLPAAQALAADGRTVVYEYRNRWSLLALLAEHEVSDPRPLTLRFDVKTQPNPLLAAKPEGEAPGRPLPVPDEPATRVYVRLTLRPPAVEGKPAEPLRFPAFPDVAPARQAMGERAAGRASEVSP